MAPRSPAAPKRPSLREEQKAVTRRRLLESGLRVFDRRGYHAATLEEIAADAGVNRGTIYLHFRNKADIVVALGEEVDLDSDAIYDEIKAARTRRELERAFDRVLGHWFKRLSPLHRLTRDAATVDARVAERRDRVFERSVGIMEDILVSQGVPPGPAKARAFALTGLFAEMVQRLGGGVPYGIRRAALRDAIIDLFESARTPPPER